MTNRQAEINKLVTGFRAANALTGWAHIAAVHSLVVHRGGPCPDGCDQPADPLALSVYLAADSTGDAS